MSHPPQPSGWRTVAVASGKGGVGKTTTAVTVGAALAAAGEEVVVVDADLGMANVADVLGLSVAGPTIQDVLAGTLPVEKAIYRTHAGLAVVPGAPDLDAYGSIETGRLAEVVDTLREEFEYVVVDTGAGLHYDAAYPLGLVDAVLLVTTPWEAAARDAGKTRELAERIDAEVVGVALTRVRDDPAGLDPDAVAAIVGAPVLATVPEDDAVQESLAAGQPVVVHAPDSAVASAYRRLAGVLVGEEPIELEPEPESTPEPANDEASSLEDLLEREAERSGERELAGLAGLDDESGPESDATGAGIDPASAGGSDPGPQDDEDEDDVDSDSAGGSDPGPQGDLDPVGSSDAGLLDGPDLESVGSSDPGPQDDEGGDVDLESAGGSDPGPQDDEDDDLDSDSSGSSDPGPQDDPEGDSLDADPLANIPRVDEEDDDDEEFTRGTVGPAPPSDQPTVDERPLDSGSGDEVDESADGASDSNADDADESTAEGAEEAMDESVEEDADESSGTPSMVEVETDDANGSGQSGLLGRLVGLFR